ncbi:6,7-dimethyl-8-ribityllumazine synthase [Blyttiomyces helicus]|uniref:6,7-dimethyl-8-ribityllumazine synthase n=1 Tax=Blyttiomyces helicus TaxID=388810 RepID=A0A4P9WMB1_9FUNG|nr:6,7-dimethyl-8-ribityllumazine synthase [Blyttiomyces helicus]|eukprot:RKO93602.1 6,7-dimethyl-8-ribityllumazine synthase [Blyttiomyces helicus]
MSKDFVKGLTVADGLNGSGLRVLIVHTRWNLPIVEPLVQGAVNTMKSLGVSESDIVIRQVPGSFELPFATQTLLASAKAAGRPFDAAIPIGVLIKGSTMHFEYIADAASHGIMRVGLEAGIPVIFGLLTCLTEDQALERAGVGKGASKGHNHGEDWGMGAVEMSLLAKKGA